MYRLVLLQALMKSFTSEPTPSTMSSAPETAMCSATAALRAATISAYLSFQASSQPALPPKSSSS